MNIRSSLDDRESLLRTKVNEVQLKIAEQVSALELLKSGNVMVSVNVRILDNRLLNEFSDHST
jgi:hypothetical protein